MSAAYIQKMRREYCNDYDGTGDPTVIVLDLFAERGRNLTEDEAKRIVMFKIVDTLDLILLRIKISNYEDMHREMANDDQRQQLAIDVAATVCMQMAAFSYHPLLTVRLSGCLLHWIRKFHRELQRDEQKLFDAGTKILDDDDES